MQINKTLWKLVYEPLIGKWATTPSTNGAMLHKLFFLRKLVSSGGI